MFEVVLPNNGTFGIMKGGVSKGVADGFYIKTELLAKGIYTSHFKLSLICANPDCSDPNHSQDIKYTIIAE